MRLTDESIAEIEARLFRGEEFEADQDEDFGSSVQMKELNARDLMDAVADLKEARERIRELEAACAALKENLYLLWEDINNPEREEAGISDDVRFSIDLMLRMAAKGKAGQAVLERIRELERQKDEAYSERNRLVALLSALFHASLERHPDEDTTWEDDWRWVVYIDLPTGQASWHIHDSELELFNHLPRFQGRKWDGHTTQEKYERVARAAKEGQAVLERMERMKRIVDAAIAWLESGRAEKAKNDVGQDDWYSAHADAAHALMMAVDAYVAALEGSDGDE